jgi:N-acetylglucosaminyl-diphospho-decaprenol L-rhamnosyltransferase
MHEAPVTVVIVAYRSRHYLPKCVAALADQTFADFEAIIIVNGADDDSMADLDLADGRFRVMRLPKNAGFAAANNLAAREANGRWLALLNPDAVPQPSWLANLLAATERWPRAASFGSTQLNLEDPSLLDGVGDVWHAAGLAWRARVGWPASAVPTEGEIFGPCAAAALYRRDIFLAAGGFDERYFCYCEDIDLAYRLRLAGHVAVQVPSAVVHHAGSAITGRYSQFSYFHGNRNRVWTFIKNTPGLWLWLLLPWHLAYNAAMLANALHKGVAMAVVRSYLAAIQGLPETWRARQRVQSTKSVPDAVVLRALAWHPLAPTRRDVHPFDAAGRR